jgi:hypothetical protein
MTIFRLIIPMLIEPAPTSLIEGHFPDGGRVYDNFQADYTNVDRTRPYEIIYVLNNYSPNIQKPAQAKG